MCLLEWILLESSNNGSYSQSQKSVSENILVQYIISNIPCQIIHLSQEIRTVCKGYGELVAGISLSNQARTGVSATSVDRAP